MEAVAVLQMDTGATLVVARLAPAAETVPGGGVVLVAWTEEGTHKGCPYGFEIEARPVTNT